MTYHQARALPPPSDGEYRLRLCVAPPTFMRHDEVNGRFMAPVDLEFTRLRVKRGQD